MTQAKEDTTQMIAIDRINILNPRDRKQKVFKAIRQSICDVGLKRPITVKHGSAAPGKNYDLVCGQGRMEAFMLAGQKEIPARVINASEEQALIMSVVENLARRQYRAIDLLQGVEILRRQGDDAKAIAAKVGLGVDYVRNVMFLLEHGEERLLTATENGHLPITIAVKIAQMPNESAQEALQEAYEKKLLRGHRLLAAKKLLEVRKRFGKTIQQGGHRPHRTRGAENVTAREILKIYQQEVDRKCMMKRKSDEVNEKLLFVIEALRQLLTDREFTAIVETEKLAMMPKQLSELITQGSAYVQA